MSLVGNERAKLTATYLNGIALILFGVGGFAPVVSYIFSTAPALYPVWVLGAVTATFAAISMGIHGIARRSLRGLR